MSAQVAVPTVGRRRLHRRVALVLYVLAALIPESIATANTPPVAYVLNPALLVFLIAFYGGAAVAIRELRIRRNLRWSGTLLLGVAFGFANEGVVAATWYTVTPTGYVFVGGVDIAWATLLTIFHAVFSVVIPIRLVEMMFPAVAADRWVGRLGLVVAAALPLGLSLVFLAQPQFRGQRLVVLLLISVLIVVAVNLRHRTARTAEPAQLAQPVIVPPSPRRVLGVSIAATMLFFSVGFLLPGVANSVAPSHLLVLQPLYVVLLLAVAAGGIAVARRWTRSPEWSPSHTVAAITGLLLPAIVLTNVQPVAALGGALVLTVPFVVLLIRLAVLRRRPAPDRPV